jgi:hypothetical protein
MVSILKINETTMTPEELIEVIRQRRNDSTLQDGVEQKIKEVGRKVVKKLLSHTTFLQTIFR